MRHKIQTSASGGVAEYSGEPPPADSCPSSGREKSSVVMSVRRIEGGKSRGYAGLCGNAGTELFQRVDPKHTLIVGLEWKQADPGYLRHVVITVLLGIALFLYMGFKLKRELMPALVRKSADVRQESVTTSVKKSIFRKEPGEIALHEAAMMVKEKRSTNHHGNSLKERMAAAALGISLELMVQVMFEEQGRKKDVTSIMTCCHEGEDANVFLVNVAGIKNEPESGTLRKRLTEYAWNAATKCAKQIDSSASKKVMLALLLNGEFEHYMIGHDANEGIPVASDSQDAKIILQQEFASWKSPAGR